MQKYERALQELTHFAQVHGGGLDILYNGMRWVTMLPVGPDAIEVPHRWQCLVSDGLNRRYQAHGITMEDAVENCYRNWQEDKAESITTAERKIAQRR